MAQIVLQFADGGDLGSDAIEWFTQGDWSHVDAVMPPFDATADLLGARENGGVKIRPHDYVRFRRTLRVVLPAPDEQAATFYAGLRSELGKPYDKEAILAFVAGRNWRDPGAWYCSEIDGAWLENVKWFPYQLAAPANKVTPSSLLLAISARVEVPTAA